MSRRARTPVDPTVSEARKVLGHARRALFNIDRDRDKSKPMTREHGEIVCDLYAVVDLLEKWGSR